eukprot:TRINITY_DN2547_c0_g1_i2.p1 TRINITY_DN2547_c0_g1~~TRINITY_DN2547_c0_g1_i2.p1  ORF type:complete len:297 (+),score=52.91 TRINITY_DN2547_c0_g1_i2:99-989(+)
MAGYIVYVRFPSDAADQQAIELAPDATVADVLAGVTWPGGGRPGKLVFQGKELSDPSAQLCDIGVSAEAVLHALLTSGHTFSATNSYGVDLSNRERDAAKAARANHAGASMRYGIAAVEMPVPSDPGSSVTYHVRVLGISCTMSIAVGLVHPSVEEVLSMHGNGAGMIFADGPQGWAFVDCGDLIYHPERERDVCWGWQQGGRRKWSEWQHGQVVSMTVDNDVASGAIKVSYAVDGVPQGVGFDSSRPCDSLLKHPLYFAVTLESPQCRVRLVNGPDDPGDCSDDAAEQPSNVDAT